MVQQLDFLENKVEQIINDDGTAILFRSVFREHLSLLNVLIKELPWRQDYITMYGRTHPIPRLQLWMANEGLNYAYSGIKLIPVFFHPLVLEIKEKTEEIVGKSFNSCLINYYRNGSDYVAWHADDEQGLDESIASVSLGETRKFCFKRKDNKSQFSINLEGGDIVLMMGKLQNFWLHQISKSKKDIGPRINITFRQIIS